jgi:hypothetical protein
MPAARAPDRSRIEDALAALQRALSELGKVSVPMAQVDDGNSRQVVCDVGMDHGSDSEHHPRPWPVQRRWPRR